MPHPTLLAATTLFLGAAAFVTLPGCSSTNDSGSMAETEVMVPDHAVVCPTCETVWTTQPGRKGPRQLSRMNTSKKMTCPTCEEMAAGQLLSDGDVQMHDCPSCKVTPMVMELDPSPVRIHPGGCGAS